MSTPSEILRFYKSKNWIRVRNYIRSKYRYICNDCGKRGHEVHHIIPLTLANLHQPEIALGEDNLVLLCRSCHMAKRSNSVLRPDLMFDDDGNVVQRKGPPSQNADFSNLRSEREVQFFTHNGCRGGGINAK